MCNQFKLKLFFSFLLFSLWATPALSSDDDYLKALESEAESSSQLGSNTAQPTAEKNQPLSQLQNKFYEMLKKEKPASSRLYLKLTGDEKQEVADYYYSGGKKMSEVISLLFKYYLND